MSKTRISYIDFAKGILILFLLMGHGLSFIKNEGIDDVFINTFQESRLYLWTGYYMPAFFVITGYCSNFEKPFSSFLWQNIKTLKIPAVIFGSLLVIVTSYAHHQLSIHRFLSHLSSCLYESGLWFLDALFISKLLYWGLCRLFRNKVILFLGCLLLFMLGFWGHEQGPDDVANCKHALMLVPFLYIGQVVRELSDRIFITKVIGPLFAIYLLASLFTVWGDIPFPYITNEVQLAKDSLMPFFLISIIGSIVIIYISIKLSPNRVLEYIGKNSLVFYMFNTIALNIGVKLFARFMLNTPLCVVLYLGIITFSCFILAGISYVLNFKWLRFTLGKY